MSATTRRDDVGMTTPGQERTRYRVLQNANPTRGVWTPLVTALVSLSE